MPHELSERLSPWHNGDCGETDSAIGIIGCRNKRGSGAGGVISAFWGVWVVATTQRVSFSYWSVAVAARNVSICHQCSSCCSFISYSMTDKRSSHDCTSSSSFLFSITLGFLFKKIPTGGVECFGCKFFRENCVLGWVGPKN